jgi:hypothetical protein
MKARATQKITKDITHLTEEQRSGFPWIRERDEQCFAVWPKGHVFEGQQAEEMVADGLAEPVE